MQTTVRHYRIERCDIAFFRFVLEGYDGAAVLTTLNAARGIVRLRIAPGCLSLVSSLVESLSHDIRIEPAADPGGEDVEEDDR
jgi:hypothetical protein